MKLINIKGQKEQRKNPGIRIPSGTDGLYCYFQKKEDSISFLLIEALNQKARIAEAAVFKKDGMEYNRKILITKFFKNSIKMLNNGMEMLREMYGNYIKSGFNHTEFFDVNIFPLFVYILMQPEEQFENIHFSNYKDIECDALQTLGRLSVTLSAAYIENLGENMTAIRLFEGCSGMIKETERIITKKNKTKFYFLCSDGKFRTDSRPDPDFLDFAIAGTDNLEGTLLGNIYTGKLKGDSRMLCMSLISPAMENLGKLPFENITNYLLENDNYKGFWENLKDFGNVDINSKSFSSMTGYPYRLLQVINEYKEFIPHASWLQEVLGRDKLHGMNPSQFCRIAEDILQASYQLGNESFRTYMETCCRIFGKEKFESYLNHITSKNVTIKNISSYIDYLCMVGDYNLKEQGFGWKVKSTDLEKIHQRAVDIANLMDAEEDEKKYGEKFSAIKEELKGYEYSDGKMSVIVPENITSIVKEGQALHHCVRTYTEKVISKETVILFIRENEHREKPFFTLEIRDGEIRQCHGMCNKSPDKSVEDFLFQYCTLKGIKNIKTNEALPA